jgi:selT/selW/selH-like putative selenoprotein
MGDELQKELGAEIELIAGGGGVFDITVDGNKIFSKFEKGHFPQPAEIISLIMKE